MTPSLGGRMLEEFRRLSRQGHHHSHNNNDETIVLTQREQDVLSQVAEGASDKEIAETLSLSVHTVKTHMRNILAKLHLSQRYEAALYAVREGLIPPPKNHIN